LKSFESIEVYFSKLGRGLLAAFENSNEIQKAIRLKTDKTIMGQRFEPWIPNQVCCCSTQTSQSMYEGGREYLKKRTIVYLGAIKRFSALF